MHNTGMWTHGRVARRRYVKHTLFAHVIQRLCLKRSGAGFATIGFANSNTLSSFFQHDSQNQSCVYPELPAVPYLSPGGIRITRNLVTVLSGTSGQAAHGVARLTAHPRIALRVVLSARSYRSADLQRHACCSRCSAGYGAA